MIDMRHGMILPHKVYTVTTTKSKAKGRLRKTIVLNRQYLNYLWLAGSYIITIFVARVNSKLKFVDVNESFNLYKVIFINLCIF
jgi:hypothetical protein